MTKLNCVRNLYCDIQKRIVLRVMFSCLVLLLCSTSFGQLEYYQNYSTQNELPSNEIYHMYQDANGVLWFATDRGICRYNGYEFKVYGLEDGLTCTTVFRFFPQSDGTVWCSTINRKLFYFNPNDGNIHEYEHNEALISDLVAGLIESIYVSKNGTVHVGYLSSTGFTSIRNDGVIINSASQQFLETKRSVYLEQMQDGSEFRYLSDQALPELDRDVKTRFRSNSGETVGRYRVESKNDLWIMVMEDQIEIYKRDSLVLSLAEEGVPIGVGFWDDSHFWVGFLYGGINVYTMDGKLEFSYLNGLSVSRVLRDHEGGLWLSTIGKGTYYTSSAIFSHEKLEENNRIKSLTTDGHKNLLFSSQSGRVLKRENGTLKLLEVSTKSQVPSTSEFNILFNALFIYDKNGLCINGKKLSIDYARKISDDLNTDVWFSSNNSAGCYNLSGRYSKFLLEGSIYDASSKKNGAYLATQIGLFSFDTIKNLQTKIEHPYVNVQIKDIDHWKDNIYLIATRGNGIVLMQGDKFSKITKDNGLFSSLVSEVYVQDDSTFWACTAGGVNRIVYRGPNKYKISGLSRNSGLIDEDILDIEIIDDTLWIATGFGLTGVSLSAMDRVRPKRNYFLKLLNIKVNGEVGSDISELDYWQNEIEFDFQAISFDLKNKLQYRYKLIGQTDKWNYTNELKVIYEKLEPGKYTFVLEVGQNNEWSGEVIRQEIEIFPPFYKTWWFTILIFSTIVLLVYLFFKYRILSYNRDISREILRQLLKRLKRKSQNFTVRSNGRDIKINSSDVLFVKSSDNYIEIHTEKKTYLVREKISNFVNIVPDQLEYIRIQRSYIVRIDKVNSKSKDSITINDQTFKVSKTYLESLSQIHL